MEKNKNLLTIDENTHNNNGKIYLQNNIIYKMYDIIPFESEVKRNIEYLLKNPINNTPEIYKIIYDNSKFKGYAMQYIENSLTFRQAINKPIPLENKISAIKEIYIALKELHSKNILLGDIHSDNFLIQNDKGYIIDLDYIRFPGDEFKFFECYVINNKKIATRYTDNIKTMISSLSLLLNTDLEKYIDKNSNINLEKINTEIIQQTKNKALIDYFQKTLNGETIYFDELLKTKEKNKRL